MSDRILSVKEAAAYCLVSPETIRRWIKKEELPAFNTRGKGVIKIRKDDLDAFVKRNNILVDPQALET
ncbi:MAG TPA: helix-turn-helix domain-containing protein [bacterium]|nr:helix-turn-helix domain-containing protein [bacterium]